jgi:hypothetical protein
MLANLWCRDMAMPTKPIEQTTGLSSKTKLSASEVQAFIEVSLDPPLLDFRSVSPSYWRRL